MAQRRGIEIPGPRTTTEQLLGWEPWGQGLGLQCSLPGPGGSSERSHEDEGEEDKDGMQAHHQKGYMEAFEGFLSHRGLSLLKEAGRQKAT